MLPLIKNNNFHKFASTIHKSLASLNINIQLPTEEEFRFQVATIIQNWINTEGKNNFENVLMSLERKSQDISKIDIVIFYEPKKGESFAEIIELKRAGKDRKIDLKKTHKNRYYYDIRPNSIASDLKKLVFRISQPEFICKGISTQKKPLPLKMPIIGGLFLLLSPIEKKGKSFNEYYRKKILYDGVDFWENEGKKIIRERNGVEINIIQPPKSFDNIKSLNQKTPEFFEYVFFKRKDSSSTDL